jgi:hypothetical protein
MDGDQVVVGGKRPSADALSGGSRDDATMGHEDTRSGGGESSETVDDLPPPRQVRRVSIPASPPPSGQDGEHARGEGEEEDLGAAQTPSMLLSATHPELAWTTDHASFLSPEPLTNLIHTAAHTRMPASMAPTAASSGRASPYLRQPLRTKPRADSLIATRSTDGGAEDAAAAGASLEDMLAMDVASSGAAAIVTISGGFAGSSSSDCADEYSGGMFQ